MAPILAERPSCGPVPGLSLAECRAAGCGHLECRRAAAAHERLTPPVPAAGATRRLQALMFNGFSPADLARRLDVPPRAVRRAMFQHPAEVTAALAAAVSGLYDRIWHLAGDSPRSAAAARRHGFVPPLAWDDWPDDLHFIDDPAAFPAPGWRRRRLTRDELAAELAELVGLGLSLNRAALRLGVSGAALQRIREQVSAVAS